MSSSADPERTQLLRERELAFFGAVTASVSHDLNNTVATIEQTAGLLEDIILECAGSPTIDKQQAGRIAERIGRQSQRGAEIIRRLRAFAHSVDDPEREIELNEVVETVVALARRMADRKRIALERRSGQERLTIRNSAFRVQQALYISIQEAVTIAPEGGTVTLGTMRRDSTARICVEGACDTPGGELDLPFLNILMGQIGGEIEASVKDSRACIQLVFRAAS
ncbi:MAG: hypothetical protein ABII00_08890 [Elusimicrobiota bacterium]